MLDTNVCINYLNGKSEQIKTNLESKNPQDIVLCSVVKAELIYGALKSSQPDKNSEKINLFLDQFISFPFDDKSATIYGQIRKELEISGMPIGPNDLLIASIAISNNFILITNNVKEFSRVSNLKYEDWESNILQ
jgi:tRNA(fMet)-specific endonuclease VapC